MSEPHRLPSQLLHSLTPQTPSSIFLNTVSEILSSWQAGLLAHSYPDQPPHLTAAFIHLLNELPKQPWSDLEKHLVSFLQQTLLKSLVDTLTDDAHTLTEISQTHNHTLPAITTLLNLHPCTRAVLVSAVFVVLRLRHMEHLFAIIKRQASLPHLMSTHLSTLLPRIENALTADIHGTAPPIVDIIPATQILHKLITTCTHLALSKHATVIRGLLHPLLEHASSETRLPALRLLTLLSERCGVTPTSAEFIKTSLLWNDPETAVIGVPLLITHLPYLAVDMKSSCEKRVIELVITLSSAYKDRYPCVTSAHAVIQLLPYVDDFVVNHGQRYLCAMGGFLGRVGVMVHGKSVDKGCVTSVCKAIVKGIQRCWIACDGFRAEVLKGCLICFMEIDDISVCGEGLRVVILTLAKCQRTRMQRLIQDVRTSVEGIAGMTKIVTFLEEVETEFVKIEEMTKVDTGRLVARFFPQVNEFNNNYIERRT